jgi:hypothetical protein
LTPDELVEYQNFFAHQARALAEVGRITMEYQSALEQAKTVLSQINQARETWTLRAFSKRGINPVSGQWEIEPTTGKIINNSKLHVVGN